MADPLPSLIIAVVDDDHSVLASLGSLLASADYTAHLFRSAEAFLDSGVIEDVDCVISDIDMPAMDGFELQRVMRARRPGLTMVLITAYPDMLDRLPQPDHSGFRLFKKPFDAQELLAFIGSATRYLHAGKPPP